MLHARPSPAIRTRWSDAAAEKRWVQTGKRKTTNSAHSAGILLLFSVNSMIDNE